MLESCNFWAQVESGSVGGWYPKTGNHRPREGNFSRAMSEDLENEKHAENSCLRQANQNEKDFWLKRFNGNIFFERIIFF